MTSSAPAPGRSPARAISVAAGSTIGGALPMFLTGALAVQLTGELAFGAAGIGLAVAAFRGSTTVTTLFLGPYTDRVGATVSIRMAMAIAAVTCLGVALTVRSLTGLVLWMALGGVSVALGQPAANRLVMTSVPREKQGIAFGVKQGALPGATMLAGLSVPAVAVTLGWRFAFAFAGVLALGVLVLVGRRPAAAKAAAAAAKGSAPAAKRYRTYAVFTIAFAFSTLANSAIPAFYVGAAVDAGSTPQLAGTILAVASVSAVVARLVSGMLCDRMTDGHFRLCAGMLVGGAVGLMLLATGRPLLMAVGAVVGLVGTWGFNAVFWFALMRTYPENPGSVTGAVAPGSHLGGSVGPIVFGVIAQNGSYGIAWVAAAVMALIASAIMTRGTRIAAAA